MKRIIEFTPAFDKRNPDPKINYGIHCVELRMVVKGKEGAVQFVLYTNWNLPHVTNEFLSKPLDRLGVKCFFTPLPADIGYHSPKPMSEGQEPISGKCEYVNGKSCYYDGSGMHAEKVYNLLVEKGSEEVWQYLENYYKETFEEKN